MTNSIQTRATNDQQMTNSIQTGATNDQLNSDRGKSLDFLQEISPAHLGALHHK